MNLGTLFTSFEGRIGRKPFWLGVILLVVVGIAILFASLVITGERDYQVIRLTAFVITVALLYPLTAVGVKRLHDRGRPGYTAAFFIIPWLLHHALNLVGVTGDPTSVNVVDVAFYLINLVLMIWFIIDLGVLRGVQGPNPYGPDPNATAAA
jgi:uncharacterized membrane protein YhaH (DUF805 family)